ncbi:hypothetical protein [Paraburkholderia fungorum]|uniref:hypothetical protein n=1 Tax=Paraburkholderia fungorum TaxID=134537 RepID=UPI002096C6C5|nr:hypothetical protein [Paraburkholderia fungorum]USX06620.1 hypothetical protein NHH62_18640 [Paraburkholderia fungorum]
MSKSDLHFSMVTTASVHSAFDVLAFGTSHHGCLRACTSSACWLRTAAAGYIRICKRRSDRFAMLAASCAIEEEMKVIEKLQTATPS